MKDIFWVRILILFWYSRCQVAVINSRIMQNFGEDCSSESESDGDNLESGEECTSESEVEDENDGSNEEEWTSSGEAKSEGSDDDDVQVSAEALKKLVPYNLEDFEKVKLYLKFSDGYQNFV